MPNYTKLFSSIVTSTIWSEDDKTRVLWITMLAISDQHGEVHASIPGLARIAGISVPDCEAAIGKFLSPDGYSRTKDHDGRRIAEIPGGWELLNHARYRRLASKLDKDEANAARQARHRERNASVTHSNASVTPEMDKQKQSTEAEAEAEAELSSASASPALSGFDEFWSAYPKKKEKGDAQKAWKKNGCAKIVPQILVSIRTAKVSPDWLKDGGQYIPYPGKWLNRHCWEDEPSHSGGIREQINVKVISSDDL